MHHFNAKGGTTVNFNGDLSGDAHVSVGADRAQYGHALIPCSDLLEIADHWKSEYRQTRSGDPENQDGEQLTAEERALVEAYARWAGRGDGVSSGSGVAKLLRIHDRLKASEALAWRTHQSAALQLQAAEARVEELESVPSLEERKAIRDMLDPLAPHDLVQRDPAKMPTLGAKPVWILQDQSFRGTCPTCGQRYHPPGYEQRRMADRIRELESLLDEASNCIGLDAVDVVARISAALGRGLS